MKAETNLQTQPQAIQIRNLLIGLLLLLAPQEIYHRQ